jgi:hypothetical protein
MRRKVVYTVVDIMMTALLPVLLAYSLVGETLHEIAGSMMLVLFITHHAVNRKATDAMFKGRQTPARLFSTTVNRTSFVFSGKKPLFHEMARLKKNYEKDVKQVLTT